MQGKLIRRVVWAGAVLFASSLFTASAYGEEAGKEVTVTAIVEAADTDDEGNATAVGLWDDVNWKWYTVGEGGKGKELFKLIGKTVKATGTVKKDERGEKTITVLKYELVKSEKR